MAHVLDLPHHVDDRGQLTVIDRVLPFPIKRVYYVYGCSKGQRGGHRHKITVQGLVCVHGSCVVDWDNGTNRGSEVLDDPNHLLVIEPVDWHIMRDFTPDAVLLVLASEHFDPADYITEGYAR